MAKRHPDPWALEDFLGGTLIPEENLRVGWHLRHCFECRTRIGAQPGGRIVLDALFGEQVSVEEHATRVAAHRWVLEKRSELASDRPEYSRLVGDLAAEPAAREVLLRPGAESRHGFALADALLDRSSAERYVDPAEPSAWRLWPWPSTGGWANPGTESVRWRGRGPGPGPTWGGRPPFLR